MPFGFGGSGGINSITWIILILIVLQWFRVGSKECDRGGSPGEGISPERGLLNNGGLFIIAIFLLIACSGKGNSPSIVSPIGYGGC